MKVADHPPSRLKRVRHRTCQAPGHPRGGVIKIDGTAYAALRDRFHNYGAEPAPLRRRHGRPIAFGPAHGQRVTIGSPTDIDMTVIRRERPIFSGVGRKLVECETDGLGGCCVQTQLRTMHRDPRPDKIGKEGKLGAHQILDIDSLHSFLTSRS